MRNQKEYHKNKSQGAIEISQKKTKQKQTQTIKSTSNVQIGIVTIYLKSITRQESPFFYFDNALFMEKRNKKKESIEKDKISLHKLVIISNRE